MRGAAGLAYGDQFDELQDELLSARGHYDVVDRAYDAYAKKLVGFQQAQQAASQLAQSGITDAAAQLGELGDAQQATDMASMQRTSDNLGWSSATNPDSGIAMLDKGGIADQAQASQDAAALIELTGQADVGLADYSDFGRRGAIAEQDRIRADEAVWNRIQGLRDERRDLVGERGDYMAQQAMEQQQQQIENQLAFMGLRMDRRDMNHDNRIDDQEMELALQEAIWGHQDTVHDNQHPNAGSGGSSSSGGGGGGMSPSERQDFNDAKEGVNAVWNRLQRIMQNNPGMDMQAAARRAGRSSGAERWEVKLAKDLAKDGSLSRGGRQEWRSHIPGSKVPPKWRGGKGNKAGSQRQQRSGRRQRRR